MISEDKELPAEEEGGKTLAIYLIWSLACI
jgi:hypothetical protein